MYKANRHAAQFIQHKVVGRSIHTNRHAARSCSIQNVVTLDSAITLRSMQNDGSET